MARTGSRENVRDERTKLRRLEGDLERAGAVVAELAKLIEELGAVFAPGTFVSLLMMTLAGRLGICRMALFRRDARSGGFDLFYALGVPQGRLPDRFEADSAFVSRLRHGLFPAALEDVSRAARESGAGCEVSPAALAANGLRHVCAASDPAGIQGVVLLGPKVDGSGFTLPDVELLRTMTPILAAVLRKADPCRSTGVSDLKKDFIARTARELETPLAVLKSSLWSLDTGSAGDALLVDMARDAALRLQDRIEQIVALSGMDAGGRSLELQRTEFSQLIEDVCRGMIPEFEEREITVRIDDDSGRREVLLDRPMMNIVLGGILDAALAAAGRGGRMEIDLGVDEEGSWLVMLTRCFRRDAPKGGGEPPDEARRRAATPVAPGERAHGSGLALPQLIVAEHGGRLDSRTRGDGEICFTIRLPL